MEMTDAQTDDLSPLEARRAELRELHDRILEATKALPMPQSHAEAAHAFRSIASADRALIQIYSRVTRATSRGAPQRRSHAPSPLDAEPDDFVYVYDDDVEDEVFSPPLRAEGEAGVCATREYSSREPWDASLGERTEGADNHGGMAPSVPPHAPTTTSLRSWSPSPASLTLAREEREESAEDRAKARDKAFAHLKGLLEKAARLTGGSDDAEPVAFAPFKPVASKPARFSGPSLTVFPP